MSDMRQLFVSSLQCSVSLLSNRAPLFYSMYIVGIPTVPEASLGLYTTLDI